MLTRYGALLLLGLLICLSAATGEAGLVVPLGQPPVPPGTTIPPELAPAVEALAKGEHNKALSVAREFVKQHPSSALGYEVLGAAALATHQWGEAERALTEAWRREPRRATVAVRLGQLALEKGKPREGEAWLRQAIGLAPQLSVAHRLLALALYRQGRVDKAFAAAAEALRVSAGNDLDAKYLLAAMDHDLGRLAEAEKLLDDVLVAQPRGSAPFLLQGLVQLERGKVREALRMLDAGVQRDPGSLWGRFARAMVQRVKGDIGPARAELEKLTAENSQWAFAQFQLGQALLEEGQLEAALRAFDLAERGSAVPVVMRLRVAQALLAHGQADAAIPRAKRAFGAPATARAARTLLVQAYLVKGSPELAERELKAATAAAPQDLSAAIQLGVFYLRQGRPKEALARFQEVAKRRPDAPEALTGQAQAYAALGQATDALRAAEELVQVRREAPEAHVFLGEIQERLGRAEDAARVYREALDRQGHYLPASRALARLNAREGRLGDAIRLLEEAASAHPESALPWLDLALMYQDAGSTASALAAYRRALERDDDNVVALNNLAYLLSQDPQARDEALGMAEEAYARAPGSPTIADTLGWVLSQKGDLDRAERLLAQAAKGASKTPQIRYHLGMTYAKQGKREEARGELEAALRLGAFPGAEEARATLETLR